MNDIVIDFIKQVLGDKRMSTSEIENVLSIRYDYLCPDSFVRTLQKLKDLGVIGCICGEKGEFLWYLM